jgi:hypothetical protein
MSMTVKSPMKTSESHGVLDQEGVLLSTPMMYECNRTTLYSALLRLSQDMFIEASDAQGPASGRPSPGSRAPKLEPGQALLESLVGLSARLALDEAGSRGLWPRLFSLTTCPKTLKTTKKKIPVFEKVSIVPTSVALGLGDSE